jgi:hypothetical protein
MCRIDSCVRGAGSRPSPSSFGAWRRRTRSLALSALLCVVVAAPSVAWADGKEMSKRAGLGFGSAIASLIYAPVKLCYALGGLVVGGLAWSFSGGDNEVAKVVLIPSTLGDYVLTPEHLVGDRPIEFFGRDPDYYPEDYPEEVDVAASPERGAPEYEASDYDDTW